MAFDEVLADRVRPLVERHGGAVERKMFGGLGFLVGGNMSIGVHASELIVRLDPAEAGEALNEPGVRIFDVGGRQMKSWLLVDAASLSDEALDAWVGRGIAYANSLPPKPDKPRK
jgi:TfoX/Sxy family transcriptional regulator of competence genes